MNKKHLQFMKANILALVTVLKVFMWKLMKLLLHPFSFFFFFFSPESLLWTIFILNFIMFHHSHLDCRTGFCSVLDLAKYHINLCVLPHFNNNIAFSSDNFIISITMHYMKLVPSCLWILFYYVKYSSVLEK